MSYINFLNKLARIKNSFEMLLNDKSYIKNTTKRQNMKIKVNVCNVSPVGNQVLKFYPQNLPQCLRYKN